MYQKHLITYLINDKIVCFEASNNHYTYLQDSVKLLNDDNAIRISIDSFDYQDDFPDRNEVLKRVYERISVKIALKKSIPVIFYNSTDKQYVFDRKYIYYYNQKCLSQYIKFDYKNFNI